MAGTRSVLVTGASTGIGRACAEDLARAGYTVYAGVRSDKDAATLTAAMPALRPIILDVTQPEVIAQAVERLRTDCGPIGLWGLVNNAGVVVSAPLEFLPLDQLRRQFDVNVTGQLAVTQACLPLLRHSRGRVVFIGSSSGYFSAPLVGAYSMSKHAIEAMGDTLRQELRPWGIEVAIVQPGAIKTPIWDKSASSGNAMLQSMPPQIHELYGPQIESVRRMGEAQAGRSSPARVVSRAVEHALGAARPRTRYKIGSGAQLQHFLRWLPDRWVDAILRLALR